MGFSYISTLSSIGALNQSTKTKHTNKQTNNPQQKTQQKPKVRMTETQREMSEAVLIAGAD